MQKRRRSICFVDDDPAELRRFQDTLESEFVIGVGQTLDDAIADLKTKGQQKPDLFVLDLYFPEGPLNTAEELSELHAAWDRYKDAQSDFMSVLARLRQTTHGGQSLAAEVRQRYSSLPYVFFTRKATLEEGLAILKTSGAVGVIKKPDPNRDEVEGRSLTEAYDTAFRNRSRQIAADLSTAIRNASWWWKHHEAVYSAVVGLLIGYLASALANITQVLPKSSR